MCGMVVQEDEFDEDVDDKANAVYMCRHEYDAIKSVWKDEDVPVFCKCNLPYNPDLDMVQCESCNEWYACAPVSLCTTCTAEWLLSHSMRCSVTVLCHLMCDRVVSVAGFTRSVLTCQTKR